MPSDGIRRELRVAFSLKAQPLWFRILKWTMAIWISVRLWPTRYFWVWIFGAVGVSLTLHMFWRWKTKRWTQPWGGWNDLEGKD